MSELSKHASLGFLKLLVALALMLFASGGTVRYWEAWLFLGLFCATTLIITAYFLRHDPALIQRRLAAGPAAESEKYQQVIQGLAGLLFGALMLVPGLDHRFHWSTVPTAVVLASDALVVLGLVIIFFVFRANSFAASTVRVETEQPVISTGPYGVVRHPMYAGGGLMLVATPLALGSWWGLVVAVMLLGVIVARLLHEERFLAEHLPGYVAYCQKVRYRLLPMGW